MKLLYLDCSMGIAGDMLMGALLELVPNRKEIEKQLNQMGLEAVTVKAEESVSCGIVGTHMNVKIHGEEEHSHDVKSTRNHQEAEEGLREEYHHQEAKEGIPEEHDHHESRRGAAVHKHPHHHASLAHVLHTIDYLSLPEQVKTDAKVIYQMIAEAESKVHGKDISEVHFHEVGMKDAIADIAGCAYLIHELGIDKIVASPVKVGFGQVRCAHGILPVPAPATANLLEGIPCYAGNIEGELCTPTGAALLKYFTDKFSNMPAMRIEKTGYGMGTKVFKAANCVRAILGEASEQTDEIIELACNIDDMTGEELGYAAERFMEEGALDVFTTAIGMKKNRPGILLSVICKETDRQQMANLIFKHTSTIGIREFHCNRMVLRREEKRIETSFGSIKVKESSGYGVQKEKLEFEDLKCIAQKEGLSIREVKRMIQQDRFKKGE